MIEFNNAPNNRKDHVNGQWPGIESKFQLVILAGRRSKQLLRGSEPRIQADPLRRRNTSIALEELKRGLITFVLRKTDKNDADENKLSENEECDDHRFPEIRANL
jgi:DNA-directed RNA polymerase omega subunit